jgi:hypothetical protein
VDSHQGINSMADPSVVDLQLQTKYYEKSELTPFSLQPQALFPGNRPQGHNLI